MQSNNQSRSEKPMTEYYTAIVIFSLNRFGLDSSRKNLTLDMEAAVC